MSLLNGLQRLDDPAGEMVFHLSGHRLIVLPSKLQVVTICIDAPGGIHSEHQCRTGLVRLIGGSAMNGQCRGRVNICLIREKKPTVPIFSPPPLLLFKEGVEGWLASPAHYLRRKELCIMSGRNGPPV